MHNEIVTIASKKNSFDWKRHQSNTILARFRKHKINPVFNVREHITLNFGKRFVFFAKKVT